MKSSRMCQITIALTALTVVGLVSTPPVAAATLYSVLDLGTLGGNSSQANGINNLGQVVGDSTIASGGTRAFRTEPNSPINPATDNLGLFAVYNVSGRDPFSSSSATGINNLGQVVGRSTIGGPVSNVFPSYAFRTAPNSPINSATDNLGILGEQNRFYGSTGNGINNLGQAVGSSTTSDLFSAIAAFRTAPNSRINSATDNLNSLFNRPPSSIDSFTSNALGINDSGQVVGAYYSSSTPFFFVPFGPGTLAFRTAPNSPINLATDSLGTLGGSTSFGYGINNLGQVVGNATTGSGQTHAFRTAANSAINPTTDDLGTLGGTSSTAYAINNLGQVVGTSATTSGDTHAFLYDDGSLLDLNNLIPAASGFVLSNARGINDLGQIVGDGLIDGQTHAFLATPVPEPNSALYTLAFGVLTTGFVLKRQR